MKRNHQVWSSGDEDEDDLSKGKGKICMVVTADEDDSINLKKNHGYMTKYGTLGIVEQVKLMIQTLNYNMHDCQPFIDTLNETCVAVLTDYNKALDEKNIASQEMFHVRGRLDNKRLKMEMLEKDLMLEKDARMLSETQLEIALNQRDLAHNEIVHLNLLIEKLFNETEAIENLVNNENVDNTFNWGWSNGYPTATDSSPRFTPERPYVPPDRKFLFPVNDKTFPEDIQSHFGTLHDLSNNCVIEEILLEFSTHVDNIDSQTSSVADEEIVIESPEVSLDFPSLQSDRSVFDRSHVLQ